MENDLKSESEDDNDAFKAYIENDANYSHMFMVENTWAAPFVTNQRYNIRWGTGLDFENMNMHFLNDGLKMMRMFSCTAHILMCANRSTSTTSRQALKLQI